jgi:hypothetical protein
MYQNKMMELERELEKVNARNAELELRNAELEKATAVEIEKYNNTSPIGFLQKLGDDTYHHEQKECFWKNSPLESLNKLKNDCSGKVGELFVEMICKNSSIPCTYNGDINSKDGTYDIIINDKKVEIKTAKLGKHKGFQHESLRSNGYDYLLFLDITPTSFYITILPRFDLHNKSVILGRKAHLRKGTTDVFKLDLNEKILDNLVVGGFTIKVSNETQLSPLSEFITTHLI